MLALKQRGHIWDSGAVPDISTISTLRETIEGNKKKNISQDTNIQMLGYTFNLYYVIDNWAGLYNSNNTCYRYKSCLDYKLLFV